MLNKIYLLCYLCLITTCVNLVSCLDDQPMWYSYETGKSEKSRDELIISSVKADMSFTLGTGVFRWESVRLGNTNYIVGLMTRAFVIITAKVNKRGDKFEFKSHQVTELIGDPVDLALFTHWDEETLSQAVVLAIATTEELGKLLLYTLTKDGWDWLWVWHIDKSISHVHYIKMDDNSHDTAWYRERHRILLMYEDYSSPSECEAYLYEFNLIHPEDRVYRLIQSFPLYGPVYSVAINTFGTHSYVSFPLEDLNKVVVYKWSNRIKRYEFYQNITAKKVSQINSFKIGFKSFLAVGGQDAGIYKFTKKGIILEDIDGMDNVDLWFPVPLRSYRDEVLLLVQRSLNHGTHKSLLIEAVLYDGNKFMLHEEIPCSYWGEVEHGLSCMVDLERDEGLLGATVINSRGPTGVLVPRTGMSAVFIINYGMRPRLSSVYLQVDKLKRRKKELQQMMDEYQARLDVVQNRVHNSVKNNEENIVTAPWKINTLSAPVVQQNLEEALPAQALKLEEISVQELKDELEKIRSSMDTAKLNLVNAIRLNAPEHHFNELSIAGEVHITSESSFQSVTIEKLNDEPVHDVFHDLVRKGNIQSISGHKTFSDLSVDILDFQFLNGVDIRNKILDYDSPIIITNNVTFKNPLKVLDDIKVTGLINDVDLANEVIENGKRYDEVLQFDEVEGVQVDINNLPRRDTNVRRGDTGLVNVEDLLVDELQFPGNISVENVNGEPFDTFVQSLCFTNIKTHIPGNIILAGVLNIEGNADITSLNGLKFPEEYVLGHSEYSIISGKKLFEGTILANDITTLGTVNGIETQDIISLRTNQTIPGNFTFNDVEITENLYVEGETIGPFLNDLVPNILLSESNEVKAKVNFKSLEVEGNVILSKSFNDADFGETLNDVLYEDEEVANIGGIKNFVAGFTIHNGINIHSEAINTIPINSFITKNTEQIISFQTLNGDVSFENLALTGLYGGVNITQLDEDTVKLTGEQFISSTLIFSNDNVDEINFSATDLNIATTLNNLTVEEYYFTKGDSRSLSNALDFDAIFAENIFVEGDIKGELLNLPLEAFEERRLSYTKDQVITALYTVFDFDAEYFKADSINGESFDRFFNYNWNAEQIVHLLLDGKLNIKNLEVNGSIFAETINGQDVREFFKNCLWRDRNNNFESVVFQKDVIINNLNLMNLNDIDFELFSKSVIFKEEASPIIDSVKIFLNGFHVSRLMDFVRLNDVPVDDILTKAGGHEILGPLNIHGNVVINTDCEVHENLNNIPIEYLLKTFQFPDDDTCIINDDVMMDRLAYIEKLDVDGYANDKNLEIFLSNVVFTSDNSKITGKITFGNTVEVKQNMAITHTLNNVDFAGFVDEMVFTTKDDLIEGPVTFTFPVYIDGLLTVDSNLDTRILRGIELDSWNERAVFINKGQLLGTLQFELVTVEDNMFLNYINDISLDNIIPLHSNQYINHTLKFYEVIPYNHVRVGNLVSGVNLQEEYKRTIFKSGDIQSITQSMIFYGHLRVEKNIEINSLVNGKNLTKIVTTYTDQNLTAGYDFDSATLDSNLIVYESINDIDPVVWKNRSVRSYADYPQYIDDVWEITGNATFMDEVDGTGRIGGFDAKQLATIVLKKDMYRRALQHELMKTFGNMCNDVNILIDRAKKQVNLFQYLEILDVLKFNENIEYIHHFKQKNENYVVISESPSCMSHLFKWIKTEFLLINSFETGRISQFITVYDGDLLFLVSRHDEPTHNCSVQGTNVWKFDSDELIQIHQIEDQELLQESLVPGTFFGLRNKNIVEFKIVTVVETSIKRYRKWMVDSENLAFVPRGLGTGFAVTSGQRIFRLLREDPVIEDDFSYETDAYIIGKVVEESNMILPGRVGSDILIMNVGVEGNRRSLVAIASHEETSVKGRLDFIKIYEDVFEPKVFHKVPSYKPSSLVSLEFGLTGETLLLFLEDLKTLQIYEYKGIEGFKHRSSVKLEGSKLVPFALPMKPLGKPNTVIGVIDKDKVAFIQAVTTGNQINAEKQFCWL